MIEFVKICRALAVFGLLQQSLGAVVKTGHKTNHELQVTEEILKPKTFNTHMCIKGPSFWCENLSNAIGCNAVRHCIETTWNIHKYRNDGIICTTCIKMMKTVLEKFNLNDTTKERIHHDVNDICDLIPLKNTGKKCEKIADQTIDEIIDSLNTIDPKEICILIDMCDNYDMDYLLSENKKEASNIENEIPFFGKSYTHNSQKPEQLSHIDRCSKCRNVVDKIEKEISDAKLKEIIEIDTKEFCYEFLKLPSAFQEPCKQFMVQYFNTFISYVVEQMNSSIICSAFKECQVTDQSLISSNNIGSTVEKQVLQIINVVFSRTNMKRLFSNHDIELIVENNQPYICEICTFSMEYLNKKINEASNKAVIENVLKDFCNVFPNGLDDMCTIFIHNNFQSILTILSTATDPKFVCSLPCDEVDGKFRYRTI